MSKCSLYANELSCKKPHQSCRYITSAMWVNALTGELIFPTLCKITTMTGVRMKVLKKTGIWLVMLGILFMQMASAQAAMVSTSETLKQLDRAQMMSMLEREDVRQQLTGMGVDPAAALARVDQMTDQEIAQLNGHLGELAAGAGVSTVELLLIIILVILIV
jgi:hypothetical protein